MIDPPPQPATPKPTTTTNPTNHLKRHHRQHLGGALLLRDARVPGARDPEPPGARARGRLVEPRCVRFCVLWLMCVSGARVPTDVVDRLYGAAHFTCIYHRSTYQQTNMYTTTHRGPSLRDADGPPALLLPGPGEALREDPHRRAHLSQVRLGPRSVRKQREQAGAGRCVKVWLFWFVFVCFWGFLFFSIILFVSPPPDEGTIRTPPTLLSPHT